MKLLNFTIIKLTIALIIGISFAYAIPVHLDLSIVMSVVFIILLTISYFIARNQALQKKYTVGKKINNTIWFGVLAFLTTSCIGVLVTNFHNQEYFKNHYSKIFHNQSDSATTITFRIREVLKPSKFHDKYIIDVLKIDSLQAKGKVLLNINKDSINAALDVDDILIGNTSIRELNHPLNPNQFNYKLYLERQYVYHQIFAESNELLLINNSRHTLFGYAHAFREKIKRNLETYDLKADELAIINALLLGQRQDISEDTYNNYANAGAIHILAVSGLHVGIVLLLLSSILKPLEYLKYGKTIKIVLLVIMLWSFALIAGLSASVTRAVTMFSIVAIAMNLKRPTNVYNTLVISMFVLLLFKPMFLFDVGFQLSYLAVFAIVWVQPLIYNIWIPKLKALDFFWKIITVTLAAQIGIVPLSLFYFHQFPGLFFISNLVIIPILGLILGFGILVIFLSLLDILPEFLASFYGSVISYMNEFIAWVAHQEQFLFKNISFGFLYLIVFYIFIISLIRFLQTRNPSRLLVLLLAIIMIQTAFIYNRLQTNTSAFIIFHKSRSTLIGQKNNKTLKINHDLDSAALMKNKSIKTYQVANHIKLFKEEGIKNVYNLNAKHLLVVDSMGVYNVSKFKPNYVMLRQSPKINLNRLIDSIKPELIIANGSNYKSYVNRWKATCENKKLPFHHTSEKGALIIEYSR